jgi:catechol 2,3-dioxygenase-like lactoylglutathione lyase family enzyme
VAGLVTAFASGRSIARIPEGVRLASPSVRTHSSGRCPLPRTGYIDHIGIGVPDLVAAKEYYDDLMSVLGLREWFETGPEGPLNYGPDGAVGAQLFFYQAEEPGTYSRGRTGLHHLAFLVSSRAVVRAAHEWARAHDATILDEPGEFPQYGEHCFAT